MPIHSKMFASRRPPNSTKVNSSFAVQLSSTNSSTKSRTDSGISSSSSSSSRSSSSRGRSKLEKVRIKSSEISLILCLLVVIICLIGQQQHNHVSGRELNNEAKQQPQRQQHTAQFMGFKQKPIQQQQQQRLQQRSPINHNHNQANNQQNHHPSITAHSATTTSINDKRAANYSSPSLVCQSANEPDGFSNGPITPSINGSSQVSGQQWQYEWYQNKSFGYTENKISDYIRPTFYTLRLKVDPTKRKFTGQLMIALEVAAPSVKQTSSVDSIDELLDAEQRQQKQQQQQPKVRPQVMRNKNGELGYRYFTLNAGPSLYIRKAFYVFKSTGSEVQIPATKIGRSLESELLTLDFNPNVITSGQGLLLIVYAGQVNETESQGLFVHHSSRGKNLDDSGLATHMQPSFARRLFPGWDEPHLKARFNLIVILPFRGYQTISNMPIKKKSISLSSCSGEPLQEIEFQTTPTMSTYLLTLVIGRFDHIDSVTASSCKISAYVYSNQTDKVTLQQQQQSNSNNEDQQQQQVVNTKKQAAQMALEVAVKSFDKFENMLGVKYPLQKFDMVALREFNNGGMENWGASIFHESYLLINDAAITTAAASLNNQTGGTIQQPVNQETQKISGRLRARRLVVPLVVAHEIAHQWFGNLITPQSWTYLWLNEGFAQLFMYEISDYLFPQENFWHIFLEDSRQTAMHEDELFTASHSLEFQFDSSTSTSPSAIDQLSVFDQLTYNKGAMVVRMLKTLLFGEKPFLSGIKHYLLKHSYDVVTSHDLWQALEESAPRLLTPSIEPIMSTWLHQEGFPLITVQLIEETTTHFKLRLSQERFSLLALDEQQQQQQQPEQQNNNNTYWWSVPILFSSEYQPEPGESQMILQQQPASIAADQQVAFLMTEKVATILVAKNKVGTWFKLNSMAYGYFRVDYQTTASSNGNANNNVDMLQRMKLAIRSKQMNAIDRFNLIDDLFAMVKSTRKSCVYFLRFIMETFDEETEIIVIRSIVDSLRRIKTTIVANSPDIRLHSLFDRYVQKYLRKLSQTTGDNGSQSTSKRSATNNNDSIQQQQHRTSTSSTTSTANNQQQRRELEDLIDGARISLSNGGQQQQQQTTNELVLRALDLFGRHFRQPSSASSSSSSTSAASTKSPLDWMDRELRASIYSAALMGATNDVDLPSNFSLLDELQKASSSSESSSASSSAHTIATTQLAADPILSAYSSLSAQVLHGPQKASSASPMMMMIGTGTGAGGASTANGGVNDQANTDTFLRLLRAYESSESSGERFAICSALGTISSPNKQLKLLELALFEQYFRSSDTQIILDSMARQKVGRQLIWQQLKTQTKQLEKRQLLSGSLRSLWQGFIHPAEISGSNQNSSPNTTGINQSEFENFLRSLYQQYSGEDAKVISQTIELVRINSHWFNKDHDRLLQFLLSTVGANGSGNGDPLGEQQESTSSSSSSSSFLGNFDSQRIPETAPSGGGVQAPEVGAVSIPPEAAPLVMMQEEASTQTSSSSLVGSSTSMGLVRTVNPGDRVNIPCSLSNAGGSIQFAKDDQPIILDSGCAQCQLDISNDGQASLTINRVSSKDQGHWQCWRLDSQGKVKQKIPIIQLQVTNSPELPILIVNDKELLGGNNLDATITVKENEMVNFKCLIKGASTPVDYVHWMLDSSQNVTDQGQLMLEYSQQDNNYLTQSILRLNATKSMNLKSISCLSNHQLWLTPMTVTAFLNVLYEPSFTISREPGFGMPVSEGMTVILKCEIDSNPSSSPIWIKDADNKTAAAANQALMNQQPQQVTSSQAKEASGEPILLDTQEDGSVIFSPAQRSDSGWYRCKTENKYGNFSSFGYFLNVRPASTGTTITTPSTPSQHNNNQHNHHQHNYQQQQQHNQQHNQLQNRQNYGSPHQAGTSRIMAPNQPAARVSSASSSSNQNQNQYQPSSLISQPPSSQMNNIMNNDQPSNPQTPAYQPITAAQFSSSSLSNIGDKRSSVNGGGGGGGGCPKDTRPDGFPVIDHPVSVVRAKLGRQLVLPLRFCCQPGPSRVFWIHRHLAMIPGRMFGPYITREIYPSMNSFYCYESTFEIESVKPEDIGTVYVFVSNDKGHAGAQIHIQLASPEGQTTSSSATNNNNNNDFTSNLVGSRFHLAAGSSSASSRNAPLLQWLWTLIIALSSLFVCAHLHINNYDSRHRTTTQQQLINR